MSPVTRGESSPLVTATIASSRSGRPSESRPCRISARPSKSCRARRGRDPRGERRSRQPPGCGSSRSVIAGGGQAEHERKPQIAALDAVLPLAIDQTLRPREPAAPASHLAEREQAHGHPERGPRRAEDLTRVEPELMEPLERLDRRILVPGEARRQGQALDVVGVERALRARLRESLIGIPPGPSRISAPPPYRRLLHTEDSTRTRRRPAGARGQTSLR